MWGDAVGDGGGPRADAVCAFADPGVRWRRAWRAREVEFGEGGGEGGGRGRRRAVVGGGREVVVGALLVFEETLGGAVGFCVGLRVVV